MLKGFLSVTVLIVFNLLLTQSSFAKSYDYYGDQPYYNDLVRNHSWKDLESHYYEDSGYSGSRHRISVIWDPKKPYRSEEAPKGKPNVRLLKGEQAFQWLKRMKLVSGDMYGVTGQRWKKTSRYHKWEQARKSGSLYWQMGHSVKIQDTNASEVETGSPVEIFGDSQVSITADEYLDNIDSSEGDTYGLVDEPEMFSIDGQLSNVESLRVEVELDGKKQILAGQQALGFLILRSYVVHDKTKKSGFRTTDKYKAWKKSLPPPRGAILALGKWVLDYGKYKASPGKIEASPTSDGKTSYYTAPPGLHGNWLGNRSLSFSLKSWGGKYSGPDTYAAYGDIVVRNGSKTARFDIGDNHGGGFMRYRVAFNDSRWRLSGGAQSISDVLTNVTDLKIRAEYGVGLDYSILQSVSIDP